MIFSFSSGWDVRKNSRLSIILPLYGAAVIDPARAAFADTLRRRRRARALPPAMDVGSRGSLTLPAVDSPADVMLVNRALGQHIEICPSHVCAIGTTRRQHRRDCQMAGLGVRPLAERRCPRSPVPTLSALSLSPCHRGEHRLGRDRQRHRRPHRRLDAEPARRRWGPLRDRRDQPHRWTDWHRL